MTRQAGALIGLSAAVSFLVGLVAAGSWPAGSGTAQPAGYGRPAPPPMALRSSPGPDPIPTTAGVDFAAVAARLNGAVVNVDAATRGSEDRSRSAPRRWSRELGDDPSAPREGSGSGFIVDPTGYVLTNFHVIEGADRITLTLSDGRAFRAEVVGVDPAIDVALLRIPGAERLPVAVLGESSSLRVGEWVCAIGNPLGYVHSVTVGVVSFIGRKLFDPSLDAFIQTDAAITFGNSGGPLINARGEVVGMTTAISSQAQNIGFAIPIDQVIAVLPQLREFGRVSRGYIGITLTSVTRPLRRALRLAPERGALVQDVTAATPGERAGLRPYDVIVGASGIHVDSDEDLIRYISGQIPGTIVELDVYRDGVVRRIPVKLTERPGVDGSRLRGVVDDGLRPVSSREHGPLGVTVRELDAATITRNRIPDGIHGVLISSVDSAGPGRQARLRVGQVILEINRRRVTSAAEFRTAAAALQPGNAAALLLYDAASDGRVIVTVTPDPIR